VTRIRNPKLGDKHWGLGVFWMRSAHKHRNSKLGD